MVNVKEDLTGRKIGKLKVLYQTEDIVYKSGRHYPNWTCQCDCGNICNVNGSSLLHGKTLSCGCLSKESHKHMKREKENIYDLSGEYGIIYDENKKNCGYFDLENYDLIKNYYWYFSNGYLRAKSDGETILMHRLVMSLGHNNMHVDHINHLTFDNRKMNLRVCTCSENHMNNKIPTNNKSGYKGVYYDKANNKWAARIKINNKNIFIGRYDSIEKAVKARQDKEKELFKEYSYEESQAISTYPKRVFKVSEKYKRYLACLGLALKDIFGDDVKDIYGQLPLILDKVNDELKEVSE